MSTIVTRAGKGSPLTWNEVDNNFTNLNTDKLEAATTSTLTNKTINLTSNTLTGTTAQFNTALSDGDFATLAGTETLTNKTITSPTITGAALNGTLGATTPSTAVVTSLTSSALTSGRVTFASTGGLLADSSSFTYNGSQLNLTGTAYGGLNLQSRTDAAQVSASLFFTTSTSGNYLMRGDTGSLAFLSGAIIGSNGGTERMRLDSSGNLGLGVTPSAWLAGYSAQQIKTMSLASGGGGFEFITSNAFIGTGDVFKYIESRAAVAYRLNNDSGIHAWYNAPSGTAGNNITFTQAMTLDASSNLTVVGSVSGGGVFNIVGSGAAPASGYGIRTKSGLGTEIVSAYKIGFSVNSGTSDAMTLDDSGNLSVAGTINAGSTIKSAANGGGSVQAQNFTSTAGQAASFNTLVQSSNWGANGSDFRTTLLNATTGSTDTEIRTFSESAGGQVTGLSIRSSTNIVTMPAYGAGAATFSAAGVISSVSDETWKIKDGVPLNPDEMLQKLEPGYWYYNEEKAPIFGADRQLGFYAQNVNQAIGVEAAPTPEEGKPWGYYDRSVLAVTVMSLQKALTMIEEQQAMIDELKAKVVHL
jgi:hypothetical protein